MPAKKTNSSAADKVKATSTKTAKPAVKKVSKPAKKVAAKSTTASAVKTKKVTAKAPATPKTSSAPAQAAPVEQAPVIPREEIQLRAYFISERRETMGWPGNSSTDWIEAEAQLVAEAKRRLKKTI